MTANLFGGRLIYHEYMGMSGQTWGFWGIKVVLNHGDIMGYVVDCNLQSIITPQKWVNGKCTCKCACVCEYVNHGQQMIYEVWSLTPYQRNLTQPVKNVPGDGLMTNPPSFRECTETCGPVSRNGSVQPLLPQAAAMTVAADCSEGITFKAYLDVWLLVVPFILLTIDLCLVGHSSHMDNRNSRDTTGVSGRLCRLCMGHLQELSWAIMIIHNIL